MIVNPETGAGEYKITGGLNGGSSPVAVTSAFLVDTVCSVADLAQAITTMSAGIKTMACTVTLAGGVAGALMVVVYHRNIRETPVDKLMSKWYTVYSIHVLMFE